MSDLETELRAMLQRRAGDITTMPESVLPAVDDAVLETGRSGLRRHTGWLVAAAVAAVLAIAGAIVATTGDRSAPPPAQHTTSTPSPTPTPTPTSHARRDVKLAWFGMSEVPGFVRHLWVSEPGHRMLAVRARADQDAPVGCNGCEMASDYVFVFDRGAFDATKYGVPGWTRTVVSGHPAYIGTMTWYGVTGHTVPTIAWQFRTGEWAIVQGVTPLGGKASSLKRVAAAVRPTESVPIELPFTLDYVPSLPVTQVTDDRPEGYAFTVVFGTLETRRFDLTLWPQDPHTVTHTAAHRRLVGGLTGYYDRQQGVADVAVHGGTIEFGISGAGEAPLTENDRREMDQVVNGIHWTNGDGRAPYAKAEDAIP